MTVRLVNGSAISVPENSTNSVQKTSLQQSTFTEYPLMSSEEVELAKSIYRKTPLNPEELPHLEYYEKTKGRSLDVSEYNIVEGNRINSNSYDSNETKANGKVDLNFKQGQAGDCWLLGSIQAIKEKEEGQEYLNSLLDYDKDTGNVTVNLKGIGKSYTITKEEIESNNRFSRGDGDVRAIEIACDKYMREFGSTIDGANRTNLAMKMLIGERSANNLKYRDSLNFNNNKKVFITSFKGSQFDGYNTNSYVYNMSTNSYENLINNHAYTILGSDRDYIYMKNPWNTKELLKIDRNTFECSNPFIIGTTLPYKS